MDDGLSWWRWLGLFLLFGGLAATWIWSRRRAGTPLVGRRPSESRIEVRERRWLDARTCVSVVVVDGHPFLLAHHLQGAVAWQPLPHSAEIKSPGQDAK